MPATANHERYMLASAALRQPTVRTLLLAAPVIFIAHFTEEGPDFVAWFNAHVSRGITEPLFRSVNYTALAITVAVVLLEWLDGSTLSAAIAVMWLSLLMFANALFHLAGAVVDRAYMPGLVTALLLYLPFYAWLIVRVIQLRRLPRGGVVVAAAIGALPMLAHGILDCFSREPPVLGRLSARFAHDSVPVAQAVKASTGWTGWTGWQDRLVESRASAW